jgi:hypothetical protein
MFANSVSARPRFKSHYVPATAIYAPIGGTIVQRKVGPGQYVGSGTSDPVFIIGDLSTVWVVAYVRETEAPAVHIGQAIYFMTLAYPEQAFPANISYVAAALDPTTRRLLSLSLSLSLSLLPNPRLSRMRALRLLATASSRFVSSGLITSGMFWGSRR